MANIPYTTEEQIAAMREELRQARHKTTKNSPAGGFGTLVLWAKRIVSILLTLAILFLAAVFVSVYIAKNRGETPSLFGYRLFIVQTGSMSPTFEVGSVIVAKKVTDPAALSVGDIVTFSTQSGALVTHRIIEVVYDDNNAFVGYRTKGDNPVNSPDVDLLKPEQIVAVFVTKVPFT